MRAPRFRCIIIRMSRAAFCCRGSCSSIGDETRTVTAGSLFLIPPNTPHRAVAVNGPATVLDVFSPVREDYVELTNRYIPPVTGHPAAPAPAT